MTAGWRWTRRVNAVPSLQEPALLTSGFDLCLQVPERKSVQSHWVWRLVTAPDANMGIFQRPRLGVPGHLAWRPAECFPPSCLALVPWHIDLRAGVSPALPHRTGTEAVSAALEGLPRTKLRLTGQRATFPSPSC